MNKLLKLIGQREEYVLSYMKIYCLDYHIVYTRSTKADENQTDKRVIRIKTEKNKSVELLVGYFKPPVA